MERPRSGPGGPRSAPRSAKTPRNLSKRPPGPRFAQMPPGNHFGAILAPCWALQDIIFERLSLKKRAPLHTGPAPVADTCPPFGPPKKRFKKNIWFWDPDRFGDPKLSPNGRQKPPRTLLQPSLCRMLFPDRLLLQFRPPGILKPRRHASPAEIASQILWVGGCPR